MRTILPTVAALVIASTAATAQAAHRQTSWDYDRTAREQATPTWTVPADNKRPPSAAQVGANGQGVD